MEDRLFVKNIKEKEHMLMFKNSLRLIQNIKMLKKKKKKDKTKETKQNTLSNAKAHPNQVLGHADLTDGRSHMPGPVLVYVSVGFFVSK